MKPTTKLLLALGAGVLAAVLTGLFALSMTSAAKIQTERALQSYGATTEVVVATRSLSAGTIVAEQDVQLAPWPQAIVGESTAQELDQVIGQTVVAPILKGEAVVAERVGDGTSSVRLEVPDGMYAVAIPTKDTLAVGGAIAPGQFVRVVVTDAAGNTGTVAESIQVLATSSSAPGDDAEPGGLFGGDDAGGVLSWATLAVPKNLIDPIIQASDVGIVHLVLIP